MQVWYPAEGRHVGRAMEASEDAVMLDQFHMKGFSDAVMLDYLGTNYSLQVNLIYLHPIYLFAVLYVPIWINWWWSRAWPHPPESETK